jgi:hypothetical protein
MQLVRKPIRVKKSVIALDSKDATKRQSIGFTGLDPSHAVWQV